MLDLYFDLGCIVKQSKHLTDLLDQLIESVSLWGAGGEVKFFYQCTADDVIYYFDHLEELVIRLDDSLTKKAVKNKKPGNLSRWVRLFYSHFGELDDIAKKVKYDNVDKDAPVLDSFAKSWSENEEYFIEMAEDWLKKEAHACFVERLRRIKNAIRQRQFRRRQDMEWKTIQVSSENHKSLLKLKGDNESLDQVVGRLIKKKKRKSR